MDTPVPFDAWLKRPVDSTVLIFTSHEKLPIKLLILCTLRFLNLHFGHLRQSLSDLGLILLVKTGQIFKNAE
jgi:hypothetical protein